MASSSAASPSGSDTGTYSLSAETADTLIRVFSATFSADASARSAAEAFLSQTLPSFPNALQAVGSLLVVPAEVCPGCTIHVRSAAAIWLKNHCEKNYRQFPDSDKALLRNSLLLPLLLRTGSIPALRNQLGAILKVVLSCDPALQEDVLPLIQAILQQIVNDDENSLTGGLFALRTILRQFQFRSIERRKDPLDTISALVFPNLLALAHHLLTPTMVLQENALFLLTLICKMIMSAIFLSLPKYFVQHFASDWAPVVHHILQLRLPPSTGSGTHHGEKCQKWAAYIAWRVFVRYGNPKTCSDQFRSFAKQFQEQIAHVFLSDFLSVNPSTIGNKKVLTHALHYIAHASEMAVLFKPYLKPHLPFILKDFAFPILCPTAEDRELFSSDPTEYIRRQHDVLEEFDDPMRAAQNLFVEFVQNRSKESLPIILDMLSRTEDAGKREGVYSLLIALKDFLTSKKVNLKQHLRDFLVSDAFLQSLAMNNTILAERGFALLTRYADVVPSGGGNGSPRGVLLNMIFQYGVRSPCLPVRVSAIVALREDVFVEGIPQDQLASIVEAILLTIPQLENNDDTIVGTLERLIEIYSAAMRPYAVQVVRSLVQSLGRCLSSTAGGDPDSQFGSGEGDESAAFTACSIFSTLGTLLEALECCADAGAEADQASIEMSVVPMLAHVLSENMTEYLEEVLRLVTDLTFYSKPPISRLVWSLFPLLHRACSEVALDYMGDFLAPFDNYITHGKEVFYSTPEYEEAMLVLVEKALQSPQLATRELDKAPVYELCMVLLERSDAVCRRCHPLLLSQTLSWKSQRMQVLSACVYCTYFFYHSSALQTSVAGILVSREQEMAEERELMKRVIAGGKLAKKNRERKIVVLGLLRWMQMPAHAAYVGAVLPHCLDLLDSIYKSKQAAAAKALEAASGAGSSGQDGDDDDADSVELIEVGDEEDAVDEAEQAYIKMLQEKVLSGKSYQGDALSGDAEAEFIEDDGEGEDEFSDSEDGDGEDAEEVYSQMDEVNEFVEYSRWLQSVEFPRAMALPALDAEHVAMVHMVVDVSSRLPVATTTMTAAAAAAAGPVGGSNASSNRS